jgi:hypothetical protein
MAVILALLSPRLLGAEAKPLIGVEFRIDARDFRLNLYPYLSEIEKELSRQVAELSASSQGFLTWRPFSQGEDRSPLAAVLHVSLTQEPSSQGLGSSMRLHFSAEVGPLGSRSDCFKAAVETVSVRPLKDLDLELFSALEPQPTGDREALMERIQNKLNNAGFRDTLGKAFARKIPICHAAERLQTGLVAIGLNRSDLDMEEGSKMEIDLCSLDHGDKVGGILGLDAAIRTGIFPKGPKGELIQGRVSSCKFGNLENDPCKSKIPQMFQKALLPRYSGTQGSQATKLWAP